jgi:hypothetical protein
LQQVGKPDPRRRRPGYLRGASSILRRQVLRLRLRLGLLRPLVMLLLLSLMELLRLVVAARALR